MPEIVAINEASAHNIYIRYTKNVDVMLSQYRDVNAGVMLLVIIAAVFYGHKIVGNACIIL